MAYLTRKSGGLSGLVAALWLGLAPAAAAAPAAPTVERSAPPAASQRTPRSDGRTTPRPAIWLLSDEDTRIYLFGTIHILPPALEWRSAELDRVVERADELVLEVAEDPDPEDSAGFGAHALLGKSVPIAERVSPDRRDMLRALIESSGVPVEAFDNMHTWAAAMTLSVLAIAQDYAGDSGVAPDALTGVEDALRADFRTRGLPISGVETGEQQLGFFARLPLHAQRAMLESLIDAYREGDPDIMDPREDGWLEGDVARIATEMDEMPPELFDVLLVRRNRAWTDWLIARLDRPGTILFAVGAGHLAGRSSVQAMLEARGYRVTRID